MKYLIILGDGMADYPVAALQNRTPLEAADKPHMDALAAHGTMGLVRTVPQGCPRLGHREYVRHGLPPRVYYSGRFRWRPSRWALTFTRRMSPSAQILSASEEADYTARTMVDFFRRRDLHARGRRS